jgi:hypothetical protein
MTGALPLARAQHAPARSHAVKIDVGSLIATIIKAMNETLSTQYPKVKRRVAGVLICKRLGDLAGRHGQRQQRVDSALRGSQATPTEKIMIKRGRRAG